MWRGGRRVADDTGRFVALQFHPEVTHTVEGQRILRNFLLDHCHVRADWSMGSFVDEAVAEVRARVGSQHILCALSGGVDSAVVAALLHRAVGAQLHCVFVDNGVLRKGEREGRPPTLWWLLIVAEGPRKETDSITSG